MKRTILLIAPLLPLYVHSLGAATVYETDPFTADGAAVPSDFGMRPFRTDQAADDFVLDSPSQITAIDWWGVYALENTPQASDDFRIRFFTHVGGQVSVATLFEYSPDFIGRADTGIDSFGFDVYAYSVDLPTPVTLDGGSRYWLSIANNTQPDGDDNWYWQLSTRFSGTFQSRISDERMWLPDQNPGSIAFRLRGEVIPEPSSPLLCLCAVTWMALARRRR